MPEPAAPAELIEFRVTFGRRYRTEPHPAFPDCDPDGWLAVMAPDEDAARELLFERIGQNWAFIYREGWPGFPQVDGCFPAGELDRWTTTEPTQVGS